MSEKKGEVWTRCGRCLGIGTVAATTGVAITCPECGGSGSKKIGRLYREKDLSSGEPKPGHFVLVIEQASTGFNIDDFKISVSFIPMNLPISRKTGKAMALYIVDEPDRSIRCRESQISVKWSPKNYLSMGDIENLDKACPEHQHENEYTLQREILEPCDWDASDEATSETVYASPPIVPR